MKHTDAGWKWFKKPVQSLIQDQRGVTGLETAIILIAFVVVASVFAFTILSTGIFSAERGKETIHAGLNQARSSVQLKGSIIAEGVVGIPIDSGDTGWTPSTNIASSTNIVDKKEGSGSAELVIDDLFATGTAAYIDFTASVDLSSSDSIQLWVKSSVTTSAGDLELILSSNAGCGSPLENIDLPVLVADDWQLANLAIANNSIMTAVRCVGLYVNKDNGEQTVNLDNIFARGQTTSVIITLVNALEGEAIDITEPSDSNADGISDDDSIHKLIVTYTDKDQVVRDIYWTQIFEGQNDSDNLLESGEKVEITVTLTGLNNATPLVANKRFALELRPEDGGVAVIERTMPDIIDAVMSLK